MKKPQKMYKNLKMLQNLDKTQIEGLTEKCKNFKNVQKIENLDKTQIEGLKKNATIAKMSKKLQKLGKVDLGKSWNSGTKLPKLSKNLKKKKKPEINTKKKKI